MERSEPNGGTLGYLWELRPRDRPDIRSLLTHFHPQAGLSCHVCLSPKPDEYGEAVRDEPGFRIYVQTGTPDEPRHEGWESIPVRPPGRRFEAVLFDIRRLLIATVAAEVPIERFGRLYLFRIRIQALGNSAPVRRPSH